MLFFLLAETVSGVDVQSKQMCLIDFETDDILLEHNADQPMYPSSMTKIMTALVMFKALKEGRVMPGTMITVPNEVYRTEGTSMFLNRGQSVSMMELLRGVICVSGNDAARALAISIFGSEEACAQEMNDLAKQIGAQKTNFVNVSGLPHENHVTTCHDLLAITKYMIHNYREYYKLFQEMHFNFNKVKQVNRVYQLVRKSKIFDGVKTGFTEAGKHGMVASLFDPLSKRRLLLVVNGLPSERVRAEEAEKLLLWGLRNTKNVIIFRPNDTIYDMKVRFGDSNNVGLSRAVPIGVTVKRNEVQVPQYEIHLENTYLKAPFEKGKEVGKIVLKHNNHEKSYPLYTREAVGKASILKTIWHYFLNMLR